MLYNNCGRIKLEAQEKEDAISPKRQNLVHVKKVLFTSHREKAPKKLDELAVFLTEWLNYSGKGLEKAEFSHTANRKVTQFSIMESTFAFPGKLDMYFVFYPTLHCGTYPMKWKTMFT